MLPGNTDEDLAWEAIHEMIDEDCYKHGFTPDMAENVWKDGLNRFRNENNFKD